MGFPRRLFFTPSGMAALGAALFVLVRGLSARGVYEIVLGAVSLGCAGGLFCMGLWRSRGLAGLEPAWKIPSPSRANSGEGMWVAGLGAPVPPFFRLHFVVKGRFFPGAGEHSCPVRSELSLSRGADAALLDLDFPLSGLFWGQGVCRLRDVFGLFSFPCGVPQERSFPVRSAPCEKKRVILRSYSGAEDRRFKTAEEERYYMREYAPGDRFRDINWKSSERIAMLITRISPDNQEKVSRIEARFRNFGPTHGASLGDLWLLDRAKARLAQFLRDAQGEQANYVFSVNAAQNTWEIRTPEELEDFLDQLPSLPFAPPRNEDYPPPSPGDSGALYVFSTACDPGLSGFLHSQRPRVAALFLVRAPRKFFPQGEKGEKGGKEEKNKKTDKTEILSIRDFPARGFMPPPRWCIPREERDVHIPSFLGSRVEIDYGDVTL